MITSRRPRHQRSWFVRSLIFDRFTLEVWLLPQILPSPSPTDNHRNPNVSRFRRKLKKMWCKYLCSFAPFDIDHLWEKCWVWSSPEASRPANVQAALDWWVGNLLSSTYVCCIMFLLQTVGTQWASINYFRCSVAASFQKFSRGIFFRIQKTVFQFLKNRIFIRKLQWLPNWYFFFRTALELWSKAHSSQGLELRRNIFFRRSSKARLSLVQ